MSKVTNIKQPSMKLAVAQAAVETHHREFAADLLKTHFDFDINDVKSGRRHVFFTAVAALELADELGCAFDYEDTLQEYKAALINSMAATEGTSNAN